jgi:hypothetical protein
MPDTILSQAPPIEQPFASLLDPDRAAEICRRWDLTGDPIARLHQQQRRDQFIARVIVDERRRQQTRLAREAEQSVAKRLQALGYQVHATPHKCPFDLWVNDGRGAARVEVKLGLYHPSTHGGRFQAHIHNEADLVIFIARNPSTSLGMYGRDWPFVIPMPDIRPRRNIAIWSECPADYSGQWAAYLEAWQHLHQAVEQGQARAWQLSLFQEGV